MASIFRIQRYIKSVFNSVLRQAFSLNDEFKWNPNNLTTKIIIDEMFPVSIRKYPAIIIGSVNFGDLFQPALDRGFQDDIYSDQLVDGITRSMIIGSRYGMGLNPTLTLDIYDMDPFICQAINDEVISYLNFYLFEVFRRASIEFQNIGSPTESREVIGNDQVYRYSLDVKFYTEWSIQTDINAADLIRKIRIPDVDGLVTIYPDGSTFPVF